MRDWLRSKAGWLWLLVPLTLPNCGLNAEGAPCPLGGCPCPLGECTPSPLFDPGPLPHSGAIFCDVEDPFEEPTCVSKDQAEAMILNSQAVSLADAAVALVEGVDEPGKIGLDFSESAQTKYGCGANEVAAIHFRGIFPTGASACLNCGAIGTHYASVDAACVDLCRDLNGPALEELNKDPGDWCNQARARAATNASGCVDNACDADGLADVFEDDRRFREAVQWVDLEGTTASGADSNTLIRNTPTNIPDPTDPNSGFDAGASSDQTIKRGNGYVEFTVSGANTAQMLGLSADAGPDVDHTPESIGYGVRLSTDGHVFIFENGVKVDGPNPDTSWATYALGDQIRITATDNDLDGQGTVEYRLIPASCANPDPRRAATCDGMFIRTAPIPVSYPLRVYTSLRDENATLANVRLVRIK